MVAADPRAAIIIIGYLCGAWGQAAQPFECYWVDGGRSEIGRDHILKFGVAEGGAGRVPERLQSVVEFREADGESGHFLAGDERSEHDVVDRDAFVGEHGFDLLEDDEAFHHRRRAKAIHQQNNFVTLLERIDFLVFLVIRKNQIEHHRRQLIRRRHRDFLHPGLPMNPHSQTDPSPPATAR